MHLADTVSHLMQEGKGILLAGEESDIENQRLAAFTIADEESRRAYREVLFTTPGIEKHLSGVILSSEAIHESPGSETFPHLLAKRNILSGVFVSDGSDSMTTADSFQKYAEEGITFAAFAVTTAVSNEPISEELQKNISQLAKRAQFSQAHSIVPVLLVDVSMYGVHTAAESEDTILETLSLLSDSLQAEKIDPRNVIIGVSMAVSGSDTSVRADPGDVADRTVRAVTTAISQDIGGILFLSDAQNPEEGTANLNAIARLEPLPWPIAFCFSRALQDPVLAAW